jgi:MFS family permease
MPTHEPLGALRSRDFRLIAGGNMVSQLGTWMQYVAIGWAAAKLTDDAFIISVVFAAQWFPFLFLSPFTGLIADRFDRRMLVFVGNLAMIVPALAMGALTQAHALTLRIMVMLVILGGAAQCFTQPAASAFVPELVDEAHLHSAISLNAGLSSSTRILGPALGGLVMAAWGVQWGFYLNAASFLAVALACLLVHTRSRTAGRASELGPIQELILGFQYLRANSAAKRVIVLQFWVSFFIMHPSLMPLLVKQVLHGDERTYGLVSAGPGIGFIAAMAVSASLTRPKQRTMVLLGAGVVVAVAVITIGASRSVPLTIVATALFGASHMTLVTISNTVVLTATDERFRGRVMGVFTMASIGVWAINSFVAGVLGQVVGVARGITGCGIAILAIAIGFIMSGTRQLIDGHAADPSQRLPV